MKGLCGSSSVGFLIQAVAAFGLASVPSSALAQGVVPVETGDCRAYPIFCV
jgi:hypothetical protein